jgi:hypothetical protein
MEQTDEKKPITYEDIILEFDNGATDYQKYVSNFIDPDPLRYGLLVNGIWLMVIIRDNRAEACFSGLGYCEPLIAVTPQELKENIIALTRNR